MEYKKVALAAVLKAEKRILYYFQKPPTFAMKNDNSPVTLADKEAEEIIISTIKKSFPNHGFMGEEFGSENNNAEFTWIIDPVDGTKNFIHGLPFFGTVLGLLYQGKIILGISNMPVINELLYASETEKTTCNNKPVRVSKIDRLQYAFVNCNPRNFNNDLICTIVTRANTQTFNTRGYADAYGYHLVATGKTEVMFETSPKPWDISAYQIIIKQAGGTFSDFEGNELALGGTTLATNGVLHQEFLTLIKKAKITELA